MGKNLFILSICISTIVSCGPNKTDTDILLAQTNKTNGKKLFEQHCTSCHTPLDKGIKDGDNLKLVFERLPNEKYFVLFVQNSDSIKKAGDAYAKQVDASIDYDYEHRFKDTLSTNEIIDIASYIKNIVHEGTTIPSILDGGTIEVQGEFKAADSVGAIKEYKEEDLKK